MTRVKMRPGFLKAALAEVEKQLPKYLAAAIKVSMEPPTVTFAKYSGQGYVLFDRALSAGDRAAMLQAWPRYLAAHGEPPHLARLRLDRGELALVSPGSV